MKSNLVKILVIVGFIALVVSIAYFLSRNRQNEVNLKDLKDGDFVQAAFDIKDSPELNLEVARTTEARREGLQFREGIAENDGMIFVYIQENTLDFWMLNTLLPLDIIFLDKDLTVVTIHKNTRPNQTEEIYSSNGLAQYVIEVNGGFIEKHNVSIGTKLLIK
jgi:uncharacterized membrane protein (UPF0127 family)